MIRPPRTPKEKLAKKVFDGIEPFTITVNRGVDAMWISVAFVQGVIGCNSDKCLEVLQVMTNGAMIIGPEMAVEEFFKQAEEEGYEYPDFVKPVMLLALTHVMKSKGKTEEMLNEIIKEEEENEETSSDE
jgi:hypothetical protein